jgi:hypothetical protein
MHRYWIEFDLREVERRPPGVGLGCGVTAEDAASARELVQHRVFGGELPHITKMVPDVDVSTLDAGHVLPNMGNPARRGIWFPIGYD